MEITIKTKYIDVKLFYSNVNFRNKSVFCLCAEGNLKIPVDLSDIEFNQRLTLGLNSFTFFDEGIGIPDLKPADHIILVSVPSSYNQEDHNYSEIDYAYKYLLEFEEKIQKNVNG